MTITDVFDAVKSEDKVTILWQLLTVQCAMLGAELPPHPLLNWSVWDGLRRVISESLIENTSEQKFPYIIKDIRRGLTDMIECGYDVDNSLRMSKELAEILTHDGFKALTDVGINRRIFDNPDVINKICKGQKL